MVQAKTWILKQHFEGFPKDSDLELKLEQLPEPKDGGRCMKSSFQFLSAGCMSFFALIADNRCRSTSGSSVPKRGSLHEVSIHLSILLG